MNYDFNRRAFKSVIRAANVEPLATVYCSCVLLELSLKQHLALVSSAANGGHDLPNLLQRIGHGNRRYLAVCNALQQQLADSLRSLFSQGRDGTARSVPSNSYPHIRYLRHTSDWTASCSSDAEIQALNGFLQRVISLLVKNIGVNV